MTDEEVALAYTIAKRVWNTRYQWWAGILDREDAIQEAVLRCLQWRDRYDPKRGSLTAYLTMLCFSAVRIMRATRLAQKRGGYAKHVQVPIEVVDPKPEPDELMQQEEYSAAVRKVVEQLPKLQRRAVEQFLDGEPMRTTAKKQRRSHQAVSTSRRKAFSRLRWRLSGTLDLTKGL